MVTWRWGEARPMVARGRCGRRRAVAAATLSLQSLFRRFARLSVVRCFGGSLSPEVLPVRTDENQVPTVRMTGGGDVNFMPYQKPPERTRWEAFSLLMWDPQRKAFLGRTAKSWAGIVFFYLCFYAGLAALFAICMQGLLYSLDDQPRWKQSEGLIGDNPGMGFRPLSTDVENTGSLIWFDANNNDSVNYWMERMDEFLKPYEIQHLDNQVHCSFNATVPEGKACLVDLDSFGNCTRENSYGFRNSAPCFFVKLNRIIGWTPEPYEDEKDFPEEMPNDLKEHIKKQPEGKRKMIWISCEGENPADKENINDKISYSPYQGIPAYYYPYTNVKNYLSPLVAVQLLRPTKYVLINIECRAWAKNIRYSKAKNERQGSVHLEVMVD